jgi:hypothetical protein
MPSTRFEELLGRVNNRAAGLSEKALFFAGAAAGMLQGTEALVDLASGQNPIHHAEAFGTVVGIAAAGIVAVRGINYYFTHRPEFFDPESMDK